MKRYFRRRILGMVAALLALGVAVAILPFVIPQICFAHSSEFGNVTVYSESAVDPRWKDPIARALYSVQKAKHFDPASKFRVFLTAGSAYQALEGVLVSPVMAKASRNNIFLNGGVDFESGQLKGPRLKMDLVRTLAHEMTHCVDHEAYGFIEAQNFASWKREGYAEYIAHGEDRLSPNYSLSNAVALLKDEQTSDHVWINLHDGIMLPRSYIRARVAVEHLLENEQLSYHDIIRSSLKESDVYDDAVAWVDNRIVISAEPNKGGAAADSDHSNR